MEWVVAIGVVFIAFKLWQLTNEQRRHNVSVELMLANQSTTNPQSKLNPIT